MHLLRRAAAVVAIAAGLGLAVPAAAAVAAPAIGSVQVTQSFTGDGRALEWEVAERVALGRAYSNAANAGYPRESCVVTRVSSIPINGLWYATATVECTR